MHLNKHFRCELSVEEQDGGITVYDESYDGDLIAKKLEIDTGDTFLCTKEYTHELYESVIELASVTSGEQFSVVLNDSYSVVFEEVELETSANF